MGREEGKRESSERDGNMGSKERERCGLIERYGGWERERDGAVRTKMGWRDGEREGGAVEKGVEMEKEGRKGGERDRERD